MFLELAIALLLGISVGVITGIIPGIHINLVAVFLLAISPALLTITSPIVLVVFIVSLAITHTFVDYIPSIFLGAPNEDTALSVLPGHQMLLEGRAFEALILTLKGSLTALPIILIFAPIFIFILPRVYPYILRIMPIVLIIISVFLITSEKGKIKKFLALMVFLISGCLGIASLNLNISQPLLPLLTGLFGASALIISLNEKTIIPKQNIIKIKEIKLEKSSFFKSTFASIIASPFTAFLPGLGASQAAVIGSTIVNDLKPKEFLFTLGAIDTIVMGLSFIALFSIQKTRTGAAVAVNNLIENLKFSDLAIIISVIIISGIISFFLTIQIAKIASRIIPKLKYNMLSIAIIILLLIFTFIFSGFLGILVFVVASATGIFAIQLGVKRSHLMGCLLLPTILYYII